MSKIQNQRGSLHLIIVGVVAVALIGVVGYFAWQAFTKKSADVATEVLTGAAKAECEKKNDKDVCTFLTKWNQGSKYKMTSTDPNGSTSVYEIDGDKTHIKTNGEYSFESITIGADTYTKAGNTWWKQTRKETDDTDQTTVSKPEFKEPSEDESQPSADKTVYKKLGKEACGSLTCFKYEIVDPENKDTQEFIWFDDKEYKLRRTVTQTPEGKHETTFEYDNVTINVPSPVKELGENQYIVPGQSEPQTLPDVSQYQE